MTAIRRSRLRWALIPVLAAFAVLAILALLRGEHHADQRLELPFDFRQTAGTSTDSLIGSLQDKIRENPKDFDSHINLASAYSRKYGRRATRPYTPKRNTCSMRPRS